MNIYLRKILKHDITHQISVTKEVLNGFFEAYEEKDSATMKGKKSGYSGTVTFLLSTDPRFGGEIKQIINAEGGMQEDDILLFVKSRDGYTIEIISQGDARHSTFITMMNTERHLVINVDEETNSSEEDNDDDDDGVFKHNLFGIHIKEKNDALSDSNPHVCIGWSALGDLSSVESREQLADLYDEHYSKNARAKGQDVGQVWRFINDVKIGDYIIYANDALFSIGRVVSDYYHDDTLNPNQDSDYTNNRKVEWLMKNLSRKILSKNLHNTLKTAMSIWSMNDYRSAVADILNGCYIKEDDEEEIVEEVKLKNCLEVERLPREDFMFPLNFIIYGAPGTGKTYSTAEYALAIIKNKSLDEIRAEYAGDRKGLMADYKAMVKSGKVVFTTFHQSYGYEEFIQGLRPDTQSEKMSFKTVDGVFKKIADVALNDFESNYVIIIDEINRANISKVFGELITLIETDKRWGELNETSATLQSGDPFAVPNNLYIIGTMNSADKSISLIDAALRRRFEFIEQKPDSTLVSDAKLKGVLESLNGSLAKELDSSDLLIGHSYFLGKKEQDLPGILNNSIIPLLYEYFYDNKKKVSSVLSLSVDGLEIEIIDDSMGRLSVKKSEE